MTMPETGGTIEGFSGGFATIAEVRLHYWIGGDLGGQPVILWHGFLETGYAWRKVAPALANAGMAVLIPDMRGYGSSDKPGGTQGYDGRALAEECRALGSAIGFGGGRPLILVAHDMGAPPALLWTADHPEEVAGLLYLDEPVMLGSVLQGILAYAPESAREGSLWWWMLALAPGAPEALVVGNERAFLNWFHQGYLVVKDAIPPEAVDEYLRSFAGREGVLGAMGVYRAAFTTISQTEPLTATKVQQPVVAIGGEKSLGTHVGEMIGLVAENVQTHSIAGCGHFLPDECPDVMVEHILMLAADIGDQSIVRQRAAREEQDAGRRVLRPARPDHLPD